MFFFFKQKTAYEMRISDWSSDVCSSDLLRPGSLTLMDIERFIGRCGRSRFALRLPGPRIKVGPHSAFVSAQFVGRRSAFQRLIILFDSRRQILRNRRGPIIAPIRGRQRSEEHTSELQSLMRISYAVFCLKKT